MLIYLADLQHDYMRMRQYMPLNIGLIASYCKSVFADSVEIRLFKSVDKLLDAVEERTPILVGLSNYTWNLALSAFAGRTIKGYDGNIPIVMGGPNIRSNRKGVGEFLRVHEYVDVYCMFSGEVSVARIIEEIIRHSSLGISVASLRKVVFDGCYSLCGGELLGNENYDQEKDLDFIPSPYTTGILDQFLDEDFIPMIETNRGCPYTCSFCVWGVSALNKLRRHSLERVHADLDYICRYGGNYTELYIADANFGILKRDLEIARHIRRLYEDTRSFSKVNMYWAKSPLPHVADIGRTLGHLCSTYIAFQSFDKQVLTAMQRSNIGTDKLTKLINQTRQYTHNTRTDILVGAPMETVESHIRSLDQALDNGINHILGGELQMLPGAEMDTEEYRERFGLETKYRLFEGGIGVYRGSLVHESQEVIRSTNTMTEDEMLWLRRLRAMFFGSVTLGEHKPLISFINNMGLRFTDVLRNTLERKDEDTCFAKAIDWLTEESSGEFFSTAEELSEFLADRHHASDLFGKNAYSKLNYGFASRLILMPEEYAGYYRVMSRVLLDLIPMTSYRKVIKELLDLCQQRNYINRCLQGDLDSSAFVSLSSDTINALVESGYLGEHEKVTTSAPLLLSVDSMTAQQIQEKLRYVGEDLTPYSLSQVMQMFIGRCYLEPKRAIAAVG